MRISDWSSDVCSSDLPIERRVATVEGAGESDGVNTAAAAATPISRHPDLFRGPTRPERRRVRADAGASPARRNEKGRRSREIDALRSFARSRSGGVACLFLLGIAAERFLAAPETGREPGRERG